MTSTEFAEWWANYAAAFPEATGGLSKDDEGRATLRHWREALSDVELCDAQEVTRQMVRGDIASVRAFERGETAAIIRRHARDLAYTRKQQTAEPAPWRTHQRRSERLEQAMGGNAVTRDPTMRAALEELLRLKKAGASVADQQAMLRERFPVRENDRREWRYCRRCDDTGFVVVWSERAIRACLDGKIGERTNRTTASVPCTCKRGERIPLDDKRRAAFRRRFDERLDCPCVDADDLGAIAALEAFCEAGEFLRPANYVPEFDDYNREHGF